MVSRLHTYTYFNQKNLYDEYTVIYAYGTVWKHSLVTFKAANIEGAPVMVVDTYRKNVKIKLPRSVDEWVIKFYGCYYTYFESLPQLHDYLRNAGVVNLNEYFGASISHDLKLELRTGQYIYPTGNPDFKYTIPDVN